MAKMSRRALNALLLASAAAPAQDAGAAYTGALDGVAGKVDPQKFDPVHWTRERYRQMPLKMTYKARSKSGAEVWQKQLRAKVVELIGGFPSRTPLTVQSLEVKQFPAYKREKVVFETRPGVGLLAYIMTPTKGTGPFPAMICLPGHGRGVDDIVGIDDKGRPRTDKAGYQHDFAIQAVENGMAAVAVEQMAFGCRRDARSAKKGLGSSACQPTAGAALLFGETMVGWRVYDVMRTIDMIESRPELDAKRVGCMGISGGGTVTTFAAAVEPRIKVAFVSGYLNTFLDSILSLSHCIDNYVPDILNWCEMYDVAGLIAPRPLFIESGDKDNIFPIEASVESYKRVKKVYETIGSPELVQQEVFDGEHSFWGKQGLPFCAKHLKA